LNLQFAKVKFRINANCAWGFLAAVEYFKLRFSFLPSASNRTARQTATIASLKGRHAKNRQKKNEIRKHNPQNKTYEK